MSDHIKDQTAQSLRKGLHAEKPGNYELAIRVLNPTPRPGHKCKIEIYVTGYGYITAAKLMFHPPLETVDTKNSKFIHSLSPSPQPSHVPGQTNVVWKTEETPFNDDFLSFRFAGISVGGDDEQNATSFIDAVHSLDDPIMDVPGSRSRIICTEGKYEGQAPLSFHLHISKDAHFGPHSFTFFLTYFNGVEWKTSIATAEIHVPNWFQSHQILTYSIATCIAALAIVPWEEWKAGVGWLVSLVSDLLAM